jgi:hypothetical protein
MWTLYICVYGINDHRHTRNEYLVLFAKSGMTASLLPAPSYGL